MILYLDASAVVKLFVLEGGSSQVADAISRADGVSTSVVTYVETRSALARKRREAALDEMQYTQVVRRFESHWDQYSPVDVTLAVLSNAGDLAEQHGLRALDALHLASASVVKEAAVQPLTFVCADRALHEAALAAGLDAVLVG